MPNIDDRPPLPQPDHGMIQHIHGLMQGMGMPVPDVPVASHTHCCTQSLKQPRSVFAQRLKDAGIPRGTPLQSGVWLSDDIAERDRIRAEVYAEYTALVTDQVQAPPISVPVDMEAGREALRRAILVLNDAESAVAREQRRSPTAPAIDCRN